MIRKTALLAVVLVLPSLVQAQTRLLRQPTYHQGKVAFSYFGDIWMANEDGSGVQRLTVHRARDIFPRFSPDGASIAFSSNREGNYDVYVMSVKGGRPRQLTFHSADDLVVGWSADGRKIIFQSTRGNGAFPTVATLFEVPLEGGMEQPLPTDWGSWASYSPDGTKMAFTRHPGVWSRKHYRGSYAVDLWLMDIPSRKFTRLDDDVYKGNSMWPMYGRNGEIYFVADRLANEKDVKFAGPEVMHSANNIWKVSENGGTPVQVTHHTDGNLFFPSMSADGKTIVYEENFGLWKLDLASGRSSEIRIYINSDVKDNETELRTIQSEAESFSLSPSAKRAAISAHGEIFTIATDRGDVRRVTESFWRDQEPTWSPNGKWIAFISDRSGREEIWISDEHGRNARQISDADCDKSAVVWSADSKAMLWDGSDHKLRYAEVETGKTRVVAASEAGALGTPQFSPDGKWISYSKPDALSRLHVYVKPLDGGEERMISSEEFLVSYGAKWTADGKKLVLLGGFGNPAMASLNRTPTQLYSVALTRAEKDPNDQDVDSEGEAEPAPQASRRSPASRPTATTRPATTTQPLATTQPATRPNGERAETDATRRAGRSSGKVEVTIDWAGIGRRVQQLTRMSGSVLSVTPSPDGRTYAFVAMGGDEGGRGGSGLYTIAEDGSRLTRVGDAPSAGPSDGSPRRGGFGGGFGDVQWTRDGRSIYYRQGGGIYAVAAPGGSAGGGSPSPRFGRGLRLPSAVEPSSSSTPRRITFTLRMQVDELAERRQVFEEAWRVMKFRFYDPAMHGVDWAAAKALYEPLLSDVADSDELHNVIMQMIGELNASHTGVSGGDTTGLESDRVQSRYPGFDLEPGEGGCYRISHIYKKGPADHEYLKLAVGNYILAVNGKELKTGQNYWKLFNLVPGRKFEFSVNSKPGTDGAWTVSIEPISAGAQGNLDYERWVDGRKAMVDKLSNGEIGYLHIRAMDSTSLQKFQRDLLVNQEKKALIIDQRFNGGGGIDQELLQILSQHRRYQSTRGRDSAEFPRPVLGFFGPMVVLQNERSASNAEMFPDGFRALGLGKVIGVPTYGAVIGTGAFRLLDGSSIRTPGFGVFTATGTNMENYGVPPDVLVDNTPEDFLAGHDRQIEKAIEVLRAEMK